MRPPGAQAGAASGTAAEVLRAFLLLGCTCFGGPVAHLGYFRTAFVDRRRWLTAAEFGALLSLCQFLPGPASSQLGFCLGLRRAGWRGGLAAWVGFTLPSATLMLGAALLSARFGGAGRALHGLQLAALAVVAQAVLAMARGQCPDAPRRLLALVAALLALALPGGAGQAAVLLGGAAAGYALLRDGAAGAPEEPAIPIPRRWGAACLLGFAVLLGLSFAGWREGDAALAAAFYRSGALVFGGGHVVLPLLRRAVVMPGWVPPGAFLAGYGAAQAMPGPLFTVAAYLGAVSRVGPGGAVGGLIALAAIFLPGLLLVSGVLPFWHRLRRYPGLSAALAGINAAVVGLLADALVNLVEQGAMRGIGDILIAGVALTALLWAKAPPIAVVGFCVLADL